MNKEQLKTASLIIAIFVGITSIVNMSVTSYVLLNDRQTASMSPNSRESINIQVEADIGRPSPLTYFLREMKSWFGTWYVDGSARSQATTGITISVTGSNIATNATVDYYIEAEASDASGNKYRFLTGNGTAVTVGSLFEVTNQTTINNHMEAMGLSTTASHTINYYLYVEAEATGTVSGEPLTSEITKTPFDTVTYTYGTSVTETFTYSASGHDGYVREGDSYFTNSATALNAGDYSDTLYDWGWWCHFSDLEIDQETIISSAYLRVRARYRDGSPTVHIQAEDSDYPSDPYSYVNWASKSRTTAYVEWSPGTWTEAIWYQSPNLKSVVQEVIDRPGWGNTNDNMCIIVTDHETGWNGAKNRLGAYSEDQGYSYSPELKITYISYGASWYDIPPLSVVDLPITLEVCSILVIAVISAYILTDIRRRKNI